MRYNLFFLLSFFSLNAFAQEQEKQQSILYVVDSIPIIKDPDRSLGTFKNDDVDHLEVVTNAERIKSYKYTFDIDKIIFVTTKEYARRSEEIRKIPTTRNMEKKDGMWYLKNSNTPYSGRIIDYYLSGKMQGDGILKKGVVSGLRTVYYQNGNKEFFRNYIDGVAEGYSEEYFNNGSIKEKGRFKNGLDDGQWIEYYSTGVIKRKTDFVNLKPELSKEEKAFYDLKRNAEELIQAEDYKTAIKKLNESIKLNSNYADVYFDRGTAKLNNLNFDDAIPDFDKAIELEPMYMEAFGNRAFARIRK